MVGRGRIGRVRAERPRGTRRALRCRPGRRLWCGRGRVEDLGAYLGELADEGRQAGVLVSIGVEIVAFREGCRHGGAAPFSTDREGADSAGWNSRGYVWGMGTGRLVGS